MAEMLREPIDPFTFEQDDDPPAIDGYEDGELHPPERVEPGEQIAAFEAYVIASKMLMRGEINLTLRVPYEEKYKAMPVTDYSGVMFDVTVRRKPRRHAEEDGGEESG